MKVALLQQDIVWADPAANAAAAEKNIAAARAAAVSAADGCKGTCPVEYPDLYVLPEMWSTGFATVPEGIAEDAAAGEPESLVWMKEQAAKNDAAIAGSVAVKVADGSFRNRFYFVKPDGAVAFYDKHHLFTYGGEHHRYCAGNEKVVVEWRGVRFRLAVCYDLRFPMWLRNNEDYDALVCVASWPTPRIGAWRTLLRARAIEDQCYVLATDRVGTDPSCVYCGGTTFVDPYGNGEECPENEVGFLIKDLDLAALNQFREKFPVLKDRDL